MESPLVSQNQTYAEFLAGGGEMGERIRRFNWAATSLGPVNSWPQSLRSALSICLNSNFPIAIYWGKELVLLYNDSWAPIPGNKHPWALGRPAKEVWPDIWQDIEPQFQKTFNGEPGGSKDALLPMQRHGYTEECYFDFTFTPVYGEAGKVEGVFNAVIETTYRVINERRTAFLKNLALNIALSQTAAEVFEQAIEYIKKVPEDVPFALLYSYRNNQVTLNGSTLKNAEALSSIKPFPFEEIAQSGEPFYISQLGDYFLEVPKKHWPETPKEGLIVSLKSNRDDVTGFLVCGLSARLRLDKEYSTFIESTAAAITTVLRNISSLQQEREKAEALSEIDRAKTTFFSNISHEFRTPLTLMLSPLAEVLSDAASLSKKEKENLEVSYRNSLRLQKLVNTLLDFSRIEAGRMQAQFEPVDICVHTKDLASSFRSIIEKEGMELVIDCEPIKQLVDLDIDMWEKIVLNLISNAFKYTTEGKIGVSIKQKNERAELTISDTGIGIEQDQLLKIFDRFHRVNNVGGRSQEGTGIGLSLVQELVNIHNGEIDVQSQPGKGSVFTVSIPFHQPESNGVKSTSVQRKAKTSNAFAEEAAKWSLHSNSNERLLANNGKEKKGRVLVADDNRDMLDYICRLLQNEYEILTASNGEEALEIALKKQPDLIISDVMMPKLDGFGLLKKIRENNSTKNTRLVFLSARAGEEAKVEGLNAGADDYLVKPFSSVELLAKVHSQINLGKRRDEALQSIYAIFDEVPFAVAALKGPELIIEYINKYNLDIWKCDKEEVIGKPLFVAKPDIRKSAEPIHAEIFRTGKRFVANEIPIEFLVNGKKHLGYFNAIIDPMRNEQGDIIGQLATSIEITEQVVARKKVEESEHRLFEMANAMPQLVWVAEADGEVVYYNNRVEEFAGASRLENGNWSWEGLVHPDDIQVTTAAWKNSIDTGQTYQVEHRIQMKDGSYRWYLSRGIPQHDEKSSIIKWFGTATDIHFHKEAEEKLRYLATLTQNIADAVISTDSEYRITSWNKGAERLYGWKSEEVIGKLTRDVVQSRFLQNADSEQWKETLEKDGQWQGEVVQKRKDGSEISILSSVAYIKDTAGTHSGAVAVNRDITLLKEAESLLRQSEEKFRTLAETLPHLVWITDEKGNNEYASSQWKEYSGLDPFAKTTWEELVHPDDMTLLMHNWGNSLATGKPYNAEARLKDKRGAYHWHIVQGEPVRNDKGKITKWIGAFVNIHDQKEIAEKLERLVTERTKELQRSNEDLQQFAHVASHDLKEPIRKVRTFGSRLEDEFGSMLPERGKLYLDKMQSAAERMFGLIDGVLNYSTLNSLESQVEDVDLNKVFQNIETDLEIVLQQKEAVITKEIFPVIKGSQVLLNQLFYNLINNALKFSKEGVPPVISITGERKYGKDVKQAAAELSGKEFLLIQICDNGIGFNQEYAEQIFKTFTRLNSRDKFEGTGLGLALCKKIVERHSGFIYAKAEEGKGACFVVGLPT